MTDILMPALSPTMEEGTLAKWLVKKGDTVSAGDVIAEIETDKATMEVEAVDEGVVEEILVEAGTEGVKVNAPIARLSGGTEAKAPEPKPAEKAEPEAPAKAEAKSEAPAKAEPAPPKSASTKAKGGERIFASPLARRIAEQKGLDLAAIKGSGPHGRIIERDVKDAKPGAKPAATAAAAPSERRGETRPVQSLQQMGIPEGSYDLIPLDGMRKTVARRMTDSFRDVPHFPLTIDLEIDRLLEGRGRINRMLEKDGVKVSVNDIILKACAVALKRVPEANASYSPEGIALHHHADIAMAVAVEGGLITPIIRKCETKGLAQIAQETKDLAERARTRKLKPEEYLGGTFSVSNLGMFGIKSFGSIINEPQGAILSVGAGVKQPVVRGDELAIATVMSVTMTCDHRVVDGATGARWLEAFKALIEEPLAMMV
ncbi:pyruvate dehydrogenase complex dihydrolipoamide acetyltransferase [Phenylobacterium sp.]|uniref:pyruvate dehydrogenase complex dihydrolipoamide acetyltransferase n=2 Tax=Phenylobacterium sp. TaxID=1871053 RepID=UPI002731F022|nr:pyruvate dehydrogenase complex dihydrolipoamide acetyltransferase [Phenylobacterium sp.]MDP1618498.1 pyruvate dehydrogenase complex dihydrolipoamide acetyltransferase [Phenylobacterium sp.]